jgi:hypothetical protein
MYYGHVICGEGGGVGRKVVMQIKIINNLNINGRNTAEFRVIEIPFA